MRRCPILRAGKPFQPGEIWTGLLNKAIPVRIRSCPNPPNKPNQRPIDRMTVAQAKQYIQQGHFAPGSMLPKIEAIVDFLETGSKQALITIPENIERALAGETGTWILP